MYGQTPSTLYRVKRTKGPKAPKIKPEKPKKLKSLTNVDDQLCRIALWTIGLLILMIFLRMLYLEYEREDSCIWNIVHPCTCDEECIE